LETKGKEEPLSDFKERKKSLHRKTIGLTKKTHRIVEKDGHYYYFLSPGYFHLLHNHCHSH